MIPKKKDNIDISSRLIEYSNYHIITVRNICFYQQHDPKKLEHCHFLLYNRVMFRESEFVYNLS